MDLLPLVFSSGWASGVNAYLAVLVLGLSQRFGGVSELPDVLGRTDLLIAAGLMTLVEFVTDKIPYLDSTWDALSTVIRPAAGSALALLLSGDASSLEQAGYAVLGGSTAFASHAAKAGGRLAINTSPEPVSNVLASIAEDLTVVAIILVAVQYPWLAGLLCVLLLVVGLIVLRLLFTRIRRGWNRWKRRTAPPDPPPP